LSRGWLLDTNVVSELAKGDRADPSVVAWTSQIDDSALFLSVITLGEITKGIGLAESRGRDMRRQREFLERDVLARFGRRILSLDADAAVVWGQLMQRLGGNRDEERRLAVDGQIAAIATAAELDVCSRNRRDFERFGIPVFDPFSRR
jgi:hypothetical protein